MITFVKGLVSPYVVLLVEAFLHLVLVLELQLVLQFSLVLLASVVMQVSVYLLSSYLLLLCPFGHLLHLL